MIGSAAFKFAVDAIEGGVFEGAAEIDVVRSGEVLESGSKVRGESGWSPDGRCGEQSGEDRALFDLEFADGGGFFGGIAEPLARNGGFDFKDRVDTFDGEMDSRRMREECSLS